MEGTPRQGGPATEVRPASSVREDAVEDAPGRSSAASVGGSPPVTQDDTVPTRDPAWGAWVALGGLVAVVAVLVTSALAYRGAQQVVVVSAPAFSAISGLVGAYFGLRAGSLAVQKTVGSQGDRKAPRRRSKK